MTRDESLADEAVAILDAWVKSWGLLGAGEQITFEVQVHINPLALEKLDALETIKRMPAKDFFTRERLVAAGCTDAMATRIINVFFNHRHIRYTPFPLPRTEEIEETTLEWILLHLSEKELRRMPNFGEGAVRAVLDSLANAGFHLKKQ